MNQSTDENTTLDLFSRGDPFTVIVRKYLARNHWLATAVLVLLLNLPIILVAFINNLWLNTTNRIGLLYDYAWWINQLVVIPATCIFFLWMPKGISDVLQGLQDNHVLTPKDKELLAFNKFVTSFGRTYSHWGWALACFVLLIPYMIFIMAPSQETAIVWATSGAFIFWYVEFFWLVIFFLTVLFAVRALIAIVWFNRLFKKFSVTIRVLHPDGAGGLSPLGAFSVKIGYLIGLLGFAVVMTIAIQSYTQTGHFGKIILNPPVIVLTFLYLLLAPITFFAPIGSAHSAMKQAKHSFLLEISNQFEDDFNKLAPVLSADTSKLKNALEKLDLLQNAHSMAKRFPVWPFNIENIVRFFSSVLSPFVLGLISFIINLFMH